jgi:hypothetical protein
LNFHSLELVAGILNTVCMTEKKKTVPKPKQPKAATKKAKPRGCEPGGFPNRQGSTEGLASLLNIKFGDKLLAHLFPKFAQCRCERIVFE